MMVRLVSLLLLVTAHSGCVGALLDGAERDFYAKFLEEQSVSDRAASLSNLS